MANSPPQTIGSVVVVVVMDDDIMTMVHIVPMTAVMNDHDMVVVVFVRHCPRRRKGHSRSQHNRRDYFLHHRASLIRYETRGRAAVLSAHYRTRAINRG